MIDVTTIVNEVNVGIDIAQKIEPLLAAFDPPVAAYLLAAIKGIRSIEAAMGISASPIGFADVAVAEATDHVTPGKPNSLPLSE